MNKRNRILILVVAVTLALIGGLVTGWFGHKASIQFGNDYSAVPSARVLKYERIAKLIWGPVCGGKAVAFSFAPLQKGQAGQASWQPGRVSSKCAIIITSSQKLSSRTLCLVIVHEFGHLAGKKHSRDPKSVMYPVATSRNVPARCL